MQSGRVFTDLAQDADFEEVSIDSTIVHTLQHVAGVPKKRTRRRTDFAGTFPCEAVIYRLVGAFLSDRTMSWRDSVDT